VRYLTRICNDELRGFLRLKPAKNLIAHLTSYDVDCKAIAFYQQGAYAYAPIPAASRSRPGSRKKMGKRLAVSCRLALRRGTSRLDVRAMFIGVVIAIGCLAALLTFVWLS
jgi:hypothetical protein